MNVKWPHGHVVFVCASRVSCICAGMQEGREGDLTKLGTQGQHTGAQMRGH